MRHHISGFVLLGNCLSRQSIELVCFGKFATRLNLARWLNPEMLQITLVQCRLVFADDSINVSLRQFQIRLG